MNRSNEKQFLFVYSVLFCCVIATVLTKYALFYTSHYNTSDAQYITYYFSKLIPILAVGLAGYKIGYPKFVPFSFLYRVVLSVFMIYLIMAYPSATASTYRYKDLSLCITLIEPVIIIFGIIAMINRPIFGFIPAGYYFLKRNLICQILMIRIDGTDWYVLGDVGLFLIVGYVFYVVYLLYKRKIKEPLECSKKTYLSILVLFSMSIHMSNYFYSGLSKLRLGNHFWDWVLHNQTTNLILVFREIGTQVILFNDYLVASAYSLLLPLNPYLNVMTLLLQLCAIFIMCSKTGTRILVFCYDITHTVIFALTGVFFWKWIMLNLAYLHSLAYISKEWFRPKYMLAMAFVILISPMFFSVAFLAWFDTKSVNLEEFYAVMDDGTKVRVPNGYFLDFALPLNQTKFSGFHQQHFNNVYINDTAYSIEAMNESNTCTEKIINPDAKGPILQDYLVQDIKYHHAYVLNRIGDKPNFNYSFYPHHKFSNVFMFKDFSAIDLHKIKAYEFVIESDCHDYNAKDGFTRKVVSRSTQMIPVK